MYLREILDAIHSAAALNGEGADHLDMNDIKAIDAKGHNERGSKYLFGGEIPGDGIGTTSNHYVLFHDQRIHGA